MQLLIMQSSPFPFYFVLLHRIPIHTDLCFSFIVSDEILHPYKTTGRIVVLYIIILIILDSILEVKIF